MHISKVDLNLFVVFDAIYTEGSLTRASLKMNLTQPAVSHALARLRQLLNDALFERQGHVHVARGHPHAAVGQLDPGPARAGALVQRALAAVPHRPEALRRACHPDETRAQHQLGAEDADVAPALERPPGAQRGEAGAQAGRGAPGQVRQHADYAATTG